MESLDLHSTVHHSGHAYEACHQVAWERRHMEQLPGDRVFAEVQQQTVDNQDVACPLNQGSMLLEVRHTALALVAGEEALADRKTVAAEAFAVVAHRSRVETNHPV